jgi:hypothetical protein
MRDLRLRSYVRCGRTVIAIAGIASIAIAGIAIAGDFDELDVGIAREDRDFAELLIVELVATHRNVDRVHEEHRTEGLHAGESMRSAMMFNPKHAMSSSLREQRGCQLDGRRKSVICGKFR